MPQRFTNTSRLTNSNLIRYCPDLSEFDIGSLACDGSRDPRTPIPVAPHVGSVVSCRYPQTEAPKKRAENPRPCIILDRKMSDDGHWIVAAIYGTKRNLHREAGAMIITDPDEMRVAGIDVPTKFIIREYRILPYVHGFFSANRHGSPILGELPARFRSVIDRRSGRVPVVQKRRKTYLPAAVVGGQRSHRTRAEVDL